MAVYVDHTLDSGNPQFQKLTDQIPKTFESKEKEYPPFAFSGININKEIYGYFTESYAKGLTQLENTASVDQFCTTRHKFAWIVNTRPEITGGVNILSQVTEKAYNENHVKSMNDIIKHVTKSPGNGISYKKLDLDSLGISDFSDGSFSGNDDRSSQVRYMIFITDKYINANIIDYANVKSRRVVRSVLGADVCTSR